jgi:hypothetical protein
MKTASLLVLLPLLCFGELGCVSTPPHTPGVYAGGQNAVVRTPYDANAMMAKQQLMQDLMNNPDLPAWHEQREKMALAVGDRVFDKGFDRVFDSMITALATLGCRVTNMERTSHYITASIPQLPPDEEAALRSEGLAQYVQAKGYPPSVLKKQSPYDIDPTLGQSMMNRMGGSGLTLSMVQQGPNQTKVKLRFDNVFYPHKVEVLYTTVWVAVDKQMFLDKSLD